MEGHGRYRLLGSPLDDAAGEAFDKVARYLGLGYPGGPAIDALSGDGEPAAFDYPRSMVRENPDTLPEDRRYAFSFSGLKTAVVNHVRSDPGAATADVAASFQEAVVDALVTKTRWAIEATGARGACLGGGVAANSRLRERFLDVCTETGVRAFLPSRAMCTDNAAMVAAAGWWRRAKAVVIDMLLWSAAEVLPVALAVVGLVMAVDEAADDGSVVVGWVLFAVGVAVFVAVVVWAGWLFGYRQGVTGTTPGKRRLGIRLIDIETGEPPGGSRGLSRWLVPGLIDSVVNVWLTASNRVMSPNQRSADCATVIAA
jgi:uncharacterized RDD family membrane protein YckC